MSAALPLAEAVQHYADPERWKTWLALWDGDSTEAVRKLAVRVWSPFGERELVRVRSLHKAIWRDFLAPLTEGTRVAYGIQPPATKAVAIPAELIARLQFDVLDGTARGPGYEFLGISIRELVRKRARAAKKAVSAADLRKFLEGYPKNAPPAQSTVYRAAEAHFEGKIVTRKRVRDAHKYRWPDAKSGPRWG